MRAPTPPDAYARDELDISAAFVHSAADSGGVGACCQATGASTLLAIVCTAPEAALIPLVSSGSLFLTLLEGLAARAIVLSHAIRVISWGVAMAGTAGAGACFGTAAGRT